MTSTDGSVNRPQLRSVDEVTERAREAWRASPLSAEPADTPTGIPCPSCEERDLWTYGMGPGVYRCRSCRFEGYGPSVFEGASGERSGWLSAASTPILAPLEHYALPDGVHFRPEVARAVGALVLAVLALLVLGHMGVLPAP